MPEVQQPTTQPQVTTTKSHDWKKVGLTVLIILVVAGIITGAYWFVVLGKSSSDSDLTGPVPKVNTKTATESAKEATVSAEKNETADWKTYASSVGKFEVKYPLTWEILYDAPLGENSVVSLLLTEDETQDPQVIISVYNKKWVGGAPNGESTTLGGEPAILTKGANLLITKNYYVQKNSLYYIVQMAGTKEPFLETLDSIIETFKFLD